MSAPAHLVETRALRRRHEELVLARQKLDREIDRTMQALINRGIRRPRTAVHGTESGYYAHRRRWNTQPCEPCKAAHAKAQRERYARKVSRNA